MRIQVSHNERVLLWARHRAVAFLGPGSHWRLISRRVERLPLLARLDELAPGTRRLIPDDEQLELRLAAHERAVLRVDGVAMQYVAGGWQVLLAPVDRVEVERLDTRALVAELSADAQKLVSADELAVVELARHERASVWVRGRPVRWLGPGTHQVWTVERQVDPATKETRSLVSIVVHDTSAVSAAPLGDELRALVPATDYVEVVVPEGAVALRYLDGSLDEVLGPGRHAAWTTLRRVDLTVIELRARLAQVQGQDVLTKDRVTIRLNLSATFKVADPRRLAVVATAPDEVLYLAMQLAAREAVGQRTLDELLANRGALGQDMASEVRTRAEAMGMTLVELGVKDIILPGDIKELLNRVIAAQKEAEANVILRREETAATRSQAQTAKVLAENPLLVRLKELEAYKELAAKVGQVHLVLGEGQLPSLQLKA